MECRMENIRKTIRRYRRNRWKRYRIAGVLSLGAIILFPRDEAIPVTKSNQVIQDVHQMMPLATIIEKKVSFSRGDVDGKDFKHLNSYYVGRTSVNIDWDNVDLADNVKYMWQRKLRSFKVTPATNKNVDRIVARFKRSPHDTTSLPAFIDNTNRIVAISNSSLDYDALCHKLKMSDRCGTVKALSGKIDGEMLIAYGMTELLTGQDGDTNRRMLDMLLRRAGEYYLNSIPALGDKYLSMGFYQFTSFAIRHDKDGREGASVIAEFSSERIPGSVVSLENDDQHRAAFYFAVYNIANMVRSLNNKQYNQLRSAGMTREELTVFMAVSHHLPSPSRRAMAAWLQAGQKIPFRSYLSGDLRTYGYKSMVNYRAIS